MLLEQGFLSTVIGFRSVKVYFNTSLKAPPLVYLYGLLNVDTGVSDGAEQVVEAAHLLHQHCVHALIVAGGVAPHCFFQVKISGQFSQDVSCHIKNHVIRRSGISA